MARDSDSVRSVARNKKALHGYHVLDEIECGISLVGTEVKSLRAGHCSIAEAYGLVKKGELYLIGATIPEYSHGNIHNHQPNRERKLLIHRRELDRWHKKVKERGVTLVPLEVLFRGHLVKVRMGLVKGKKLYDKREDQKRKSAKRDMDREMGRRR